MVNSACKGGRAVVVDLRSAAHLLRLFSQTPKIFIEDKRWLAAYARAWVSEYQAAAARLGVLTLKP
jgi:hypothetical protein